MVIAVFAASVAGGQTAPREFVVVAMGDSYASGEGAPELPGSFSYDSATRRWVGTRETWTRRGDDLDQARRCHRSPLSGFGQAIDRVRRTFAASEVTVTFRSVACSGAGIRFTKDPLSGLPGTSTTGGGLLTRYIGFAGENGPGDAPLAPQVQAIREHLTQTNKRADAVLLNVGGNDFGFAHLIFLCAVIEYIADAGGVATDGAGCHRNRLAQVVLGGASAPTSTSYALSTAREGIARRCAFLTPQQVVAQICTPSLRASYALLGDALRGVPPRTFRRCTGAQEAGAEARRPLARVGTALTVLGARCTKRSSNSIANPLGVWTRLDGVYPNLATTPNAGSLAAGGRVYIATVPDLLTDETGATCNRQPGDDGATRKVTLAESVFLRQTVRPALNAEITDAARRNGWTVLPVASAVGHGICATAADRFFNTNRDSLATQGEDASPEPFSYVRLRGSEPALSGGWVHPNARGYRALYSAPIALALRAQICARFALAPCPALAP